MGRMARGEKSFLLNVRAIWQSWEIGYLKEWETNVLQNS